ncbi:unnamed protein product, partial [marine sediment metagenome]
IVGFLAQKMNPTDAACCGCFVHGLTGDIVSKKIGKRAMIPSDLLDYLGPAFRHIE